LVQYGPRAWKWCGGEWVEVLTEIPEEVLAVAETLRNVPGNGKTALEYSEDRKSTP
jgi:hypothetical protein